MKYTLRSYSIGKVYYWATIATHTMMWGFFRRIYLNRINKVPTHTPVLLAVNHPTAFVEPCILCIYLDPPIYNMTRGDIFKKPFYRKLMESINMFPVYRVRDGYASRDRNDEVFEYCISRLQQNQVVTIYVEGEHHLEKHVKPSQKGIARIAFAAYERNPNTELCIVPVGCNYELGDQPRDTVTINVGEPIPIHTYWEQYLQSSAQTINKLCLDVESALKQLCFHIEDESDYALAEQLLTMHRSDHPTPLFPIVINNTPYFAAEKQVCDQLNQLPVPEKETLRQVVNAYFNELHQAGLTDASISNPTFKTNWWLLFFIGLFPAYFIGFLAAWPVKRFSQGLVAAKVKKKEFVTSVLMGSGFMFGFLFYILLLLISLFTQRPVLIGLALLLPGLAWFSMFYIELWRPWKNCQKAQKHPKKPYFQQKRAAILSMFKFPG
jgi:1-acyl-sn-glycerol-3-phosphate acyltransferase